MDELLLFGLNTTFPANLKLGLSIIALFVLFSILSRKIDFLGGMVGGCIAFCIFLGGNFYQLGYLFLFFVLGSAASNFKIKEKQKVGLAEKDEGRRSYKNALANGGVAAILGVQAWLLPEMNALFHLMLAASFASAASDTFSSELGNYFGKKYYHVITWKRAQRGLDGVVSLEGSFAGVVGSLLIAVYYFWWEASFQGTLLVFLAGLLGNFSDSVLGATLQPKGWLNNHTVNFLNTLFAALTAFIGYFLLNSLS